MPHHSRLMLAAVAATALLGLVVGSASARSLSTDEKNFELIWDNALTGKTKLELIDNTAGLNLQCKVTLLGRFRENTITKTGGNNQGTINHGEVSECEGGSATIKQETFPWNLRYRSFTGTLPRITSISAGLIGARFHFESAGLGCESTTEANHPGIGIAEGGLESTGEPENITADRNGRIPLRGNFLCEFAGEGNFGGTGLIRNLPRTAKLNIQLIEGAPVTLEPSPISFGTLEVESLARRTVTMTINSSLTVRALSVRAGNYFAITDPNRCVGARFEARSTCAFRVLFSAPGERGREFSDTVIVETSLGNVEDSVTART